MNEKWPRVRNHQKPEMGRRRLDLEYRSTLFIAAAELLTSFIEQAESRLRLVYS
jgi:hypothetical protein